MAKKMTVGDIAGMDKDSEIHFILNGERIQPFEWWPTEHGPMINFRTEEDKKAKVLNYDFAQDACVIDDEAAG